MKEKILNNSEVSPGDPVSKYHLLWHGKKESREVALITEGDMITIGHSSD